NSLSETAIFRYIGVNQPFDDNAVIVIKVSFRHAERLEDVRFCELTQGLARNTLDDDRQQNVPSVGVEILFTWAMVQGTLPRHHVEYVFLCNNVGIAPAGHLHHLQKVAQSASVMDQLTQRDSLAKVRR